MAVPRVMVELSANSAKLVTEVEKANKALSGVGKSAAAMQKSLSLISAAAIVNLGQQAINAGQQIYNFARSIASAGNDIQRMSRVFNMTTDDFQKWSYVTKMADVDIEGFGQGFKFLTRSMSEALQGSGDASKAFNLLGINLKDSTGKTKDQQTVFMEVIGTLGKYADGVDRDALMLAIFGKGWMSVKPLVDQGTKTIEENRKEFERLNAILGKDTIRILSESEDAFKRWEAVWKASKISFWTPMIQTFTDLLEKILALKTAFAEGGFKGLWEQANRHEMEAMGEQNWKFYGGATQSTKDWVAGWTPPVAKPKPQAPGLPGAGVPEWRTIIGEERTQAEKEYWEAQHKTWEIEDNLIKIEGERAQLLADDMFPSMDNVTKIQEQMTKGAEELRIKLFEVQTLVRDFGWEDYASGVIDASSAGERAVNQLAIANEKSAEKFRKDMEESDAIIKTFAGGLSSAWSTNMTSMLKGTQSFGEAVKNIFMSMADSVISSITKMATNWALFGNMSGKEKEGGGYGGLIGLIGSIFAEGGILSGHFTPIRQFAGGGIADRPTLGMVGEGGGAEAVVPLKGGSIPVEMSGGGGSTVIIMNIEATDVDSFERKYGGSVNKIFKTSARKGGVARKSMRSYI